jgi:hypothetical protein
MSPSCIGAKAAIAVNTKRAFEEYLDKNKKGKVGATV